MFKVRIQPSALEDVRRHFRYLKEHAHTPSYGDQWYDELQAAIASLRDFPFSCPLAPENDHFEEAIRHRLFGSYRVLFTVVNTEIHVLHVRHGRQDILEAE